MSRFLYTLLAVALIHPVGSAVADAGAERPACARPLKIGVSLPLTAGPTSSGKAVLNSITLADELYDTKGCVDFLIQDDQLVAKNTLTVVQKFITQDKVDGLIVYGTQTALAVAELVDRSKTPLIALSILAKVVEGRSHVMKHWCTAERLNDAVVAEAGRRGYRRVAIFSTVNDAMLGLRDLFRKTSKAEVVIDEELLKDQFDYASVITKLTARPADAVYVLLYPPQIGPFMKRLRESGYRGDAFGVHNVEDPSEVAVSQGAMLGMWLANGDESAGEDYPARYRRRFGEAPALGGGDGFDAAKLFIEAAYQAKPVNELLHSVRDFHGAFGVYAATPQNDFDFQAVIKTVTKDGFVTERR